MLVVGDREQEQDEVSVREHREGDTGVGVGEQFVERFDELVKSRTLGMSHAAILAHVDRSSYTSRRRLRHRRHRS